MKKFTDWMKLEEIKLTKVKPVNQNPSPNEVDKVNPDKTPLQRKSAEQFKNKTDQLKPVKSDKKDTI